MTGSGRRIRFAMRFGKRAFITDVLVDFWAYVMFVLIIIVFAILYTYAIKAKMQALEGAKDITYGNYLAQVYLRKPVTVGNTEMTVAELIAMYDYNQSMEPTESRFEQFFASPTAFIVGTRNPMRDALMDLTDNFVEKYFDENKCFVFSIHGSAFDYTRRGGGCFGAQTFSMHYLLAQLPRLPNTTYVTYVAPIDPREDPILIYSIYNFEGLLAIYSDDPYFDMDEASKAVNLAMCRMNSIPLIYDACSR